MKIIIAVSGLFAFVGLTSIPGTAQAQATASPEVTAAPAQPTFPPAQAQPIAPNQPTFPPAQAQPIAPNQPLPAGQPQPVAPAQPYPAAQPQAYVLVPVAQMPLAPAPVEPVEDPAQKRLWAKSRYGLALTLLGPNSLVGGGFAMQPIRWLELLAWGGYNSASASGGDGSAYAEADIRLITALARVRAWPLEKHSVVVDTGFGITNYSMSASGHDTAYPDSTIEYRRKGTPPIVNLGAGYGYRSNSMFRVTAILGVLLHTKKLGAGSITCDSTYHPQDCELLRADVDGAGNELTKPRPYLEGTVGLLF